MLFEAALAVVTVALVWRVVDASERRLAERLRLLEISAGVLSGQQSRFESSVEKLAVAVEGYRKAIAEAEEAPEIVPDQNVTAASRVAALRSQLWNLESLAATPPVER